MRKDPSGTKKFVGATACSITALLAGCVYSARVAGVGVCLRRILVLTREMFVKCQEAVLFEKDLSVVDGRRHRVRGVIVRMGRYDDVPRLRQLLPRSPSGLFVRRLSRGDIFFVAQSGEEIVHQVWITFKDRWVPFLDKRVVLREKEAYLYQSYTAPDFRGKNILPAVTSIALTYLKIKEYRKLLFHVDLKNHSSPQAYQRISTAEVGTTIRYRRILGFKSYRYESYRADSQSCSSPRRHDPAWRGENLEGLSEQR